MGNRTQIWRGVRQRLRMRLGRDDFLDGGVLDSGMVYRDVPALFYADDGLLLVRCCAEAT